jgi:hypothetical protein
METFKGTAIMFVRLHLSIGVAFLALHFWRYIFGVTFLALHFVEGFEVVDTTKILKKS